MFVNLHDLCICVPSDLKIFKIKQAFFVVFSKKSENYPDFAYAIQVGYFRRDFQRSLSEFDSDGDNLAGPYFSAVLRVRNVVSLPHSTLLEGDRGARGRQLYSLK